MTVLPPTERRNPECVAVWPECFSGGFDPKCCRFPKSCSCSSNCWRTQGVPISPSEPALAATPEMLTPDELRAMDLTVELVNLVGSRIIGRGASREGDVNEFVGHIHLIQQMIMSQAAGRAYPDRFRLLGQIAPATSTTPAAPTEPVDAPTESPFARAAAAAINSALMPSAVRPKPACTARWTASRPETDTLSVEHVCHLDLNHDGRCVCPCGATR